MLQDRHGSAVRSASRGELAAQEVGLGFINFLLAPPGNFFVSGGAGGIKEEADAGVGGAFMQVVHCVVIGNDGLIYVYDRQADRIQVFDKMGKFKNNIWIKRGTSLPDNWAPIGGSAFLLIASRNTCTSTTEAMSRSKF
jgi:hypothetical protein